MIIFLIVIIGLFAGVSILMYWYMLCLKKKNLVYPIDDKEGLDINRNIVYKKAEGKNLLMDVYTPAKAGSQKLPVVIFVHGEGPEIFIKDAKDWGVYTSYGKLLAGKGYIAVTFNHRYAAKNFNKIKEVTEDVTDAVKYVQRNADGWNIDINKIFIWSFSLGGIYSSVFLNPFYRVKAVISYYGLLDISEKVPLKMQKYFDDYVPDKYLHNVGNTKILIVRAGKDKTKRLNKSIDRFIEIADKYHVDYEYMIHSTGGHSFDVFTDNEETRSIIDKTLKFIENNSRFEG